jgi:thiamine biosynthesis protein ThiS
VHIQVNGESRGVNDSTTVAGLLRELDVRVDRVAVELNLEILAKDDFDARFLHEGDRIEILSFIGGGAA